MDITLFLAQVIGIYMLVAGLSGVFYPDRMGRAMQEFSKSTILPYFDGAMALIVGLVIVLMHNVWVGLPATLITIIGWIAVAEGLIMMLLPQASISALASKMNTRNFCMTFAVIAIAVGAYLVWFGFFV